MAKIETIALVAAGVLFSTPAFAGSSGYGAYVNGVQADDGVYSNYTLPAEYYTQCLGCAQELSDGASAYYFNRMWYSYNGSSYFFSVGWYKYQSSGTIYRYPAYENDQPGSDQIYYFTAYPWTPGSGSTWSAGMWRANGTDWHMNWWGPNSYNFGYDDTNAAAANSPFEIDDGGFAWNCWNNYNYSTSGTIARQASTGSWYDISGTSTYTAGTAPPSWSASGDPNNGDTYTLTSACSSGN